MNIQERCYIKPIVKMRKSCLKKHVESFVKVIGAEQKPGFKRLPYQAFSFFLLYSTS